MKQEVKTDFTYYGNRSYIHSSTLIGELLNHFSYYDKILLDEVKMIHRVTENGLYYFTFDLPKTEQKELLKQASLSARILADGKDHQVYFIPDGNQAVVKRVEWGREKLLVNEFNYISQYQGSAKIQPMGEGLDIIIGVIEYLKSLHIATVAEAKKVTVGYFRGYQHDFTRDFENSEWVIESAGKVLFSKDNMVYTLNEVTLSNGDYQNSFEVCYTYEV